VSLKSNEIENLSDELWKIKIRAMLNQQIYDYGFDNAAMRRWKMWIEINCKERPYEL